MSKKNQGVKTRSLLLLLCMFSLRIDATAQVWHEQAMHNEVKISFPAAPEHKYLDDSGRETYITHADGCGFMVGIAPHVVDNYGQYQKEPDSVQLKLGLKVLGDIANGKVSYNNQHLISMKSFRSGKTIGLDMEYTTKEPSDPGSRKRFSTLLLIKDTCYILECWYLDDREHDAEREKFFKSVLLKG